MQLSAYFSFKISDWPVYHLVGLILLLLFSGSAAQAATDPPVMTMSSGSTAFVEDGAPVVIDPLLIVSGTNTIVIDGANVTIADGYVASEDSLLYTTTAGISGSFSTTTGVLTLTGNASPSDYQAALRAVQYQNTNTVSLDAGTRTISYALGGSLPFSENGHFYEFVTASGISWTAARDAAVTRTLFGLQGYLTTVTSANENAFIFSKLVGQGWMGANDTAVEGDWRWVTGPETDTAFWSGVGDGSAVGGEYNNWASGEPNQSGGNEDYAHFFSTGTWNDFPESNNTISGYIVEYGSMPGDPVLQITGNKSVSVTAQNNAPSFSAGATLAAVNEDTLSPAGMAVSSLLNGAFSDGDTGSSLSGIAVSADASIAGVQGDWEYSTDSGSTWFDIGSVSASSALLLSASSQLRFNPFLNYSGTPGALIVFAVDESGTTAYASGSTRQVFDTTADDSTSAVSASGVSVGINVVAINDAPVITSNGGGDTATVSMAENQTAVTTVTSTDVENNTVTYSLTGGTDQAKFSLAGGVLTFINAPDFENPTDSDDGNTYVVAVTATDNGTGNLTDTQTITVTVTNNNEAPVITSNGGGDTATVSMAENQTAVTTVTSTDVENNTVTYSLTGGADQAKFSLAGGVLTFINAPDFENPTDSDEGNTYVVAVTATDNGTGNLTDTQTMTVTVTNNNEAPVITSNGGGDTATVSMAENQTAVTTVTSTDVENNTVTYSLTGGTDQAKFSLAGGVLTFINAPNFENPTDSDEGNTYVVEVTATDNGSGSLTDIQTLIVTITDSNEPPVLTISTGNTVFVEDGVAVAIDSQLTVVEPNATAIEGATVAIAGGYVASEDRLIYAETAGISGSFSMATGVLTLTGSAAAADYQAALRAVQYQNTNTANPDIGTRTIRYALGSSLSFSENGHFYEFVTASGISWTAARDAAAVRTLFGLQGYLTTVTSENENAFIVSKLVGQGWMGANDTAIEGDWRWVTGPETDTAFWNGVANGSPVGGEYNNWASGEPNQWGGNEDYAHFLSTGKWNDFPLSLGSISGYVVEYGSMPGDPVLQITGNKSVSVTAQNDAPTGSVNLSGLLVEGQTLTASTSSIVDLDGLSIFSYQWQRDGVDIKGATEASYVLTAADIGRGITVVVSYNDDGGSAESLSSVLSAAVDSDLDGDGIGDAIDTDIDGDGLSNAYEIANGLNSRNASDRDTDLDNDGVSNYNEFVAESNANADDNPPVLSVPADISVNATGLFTAIDLGNATALDTLDDEVTARITHLNGEAVSATPTRFSPGAHVITWGASDTANNVASATQAVNVTPLVEFNKSQDSAEGATARFRVILNGSAVTYPVTVPYAVSGTAATDGSDHDLVDGSVTINSPDLEATVSFNLVDDGAGEGMETLIVTLGTPENAVPGAMVRHNVAIYEGNVAPIVSLSADQGNGVTRLVTQAGGLVVVAAAVTDANVNDVHGYDWSATDNVLVDTDSDVATFSFDPADLPAGVYTLNVSVNDGLETVWTQLVFNVIASAPILTAIDSDGDGIDDATEGYGDSDGDGVPDYLDNSNIAQNVVQQRNSDIEMFLMETEPGLVLSLGSIAFVSGNGQTGVSDNDLEQYGDGGVSGVSDASYAFNNGLFDFNIEGLRIPGQSVSIVVAQDAAIPAQAIYRKLMPNGWQDFVEDSNNGLASAPGVEGYCPPPGDSSFVPGLTQGHWCVELTIEDGGPNDADGVVNQVVKDPGGVAVLTATPVTVTVTGSGGGGSISLWLVLFVGLMMGARYVKGQRLMLAMFCAAGSLGVANAQFLFKPDYIGFNYLSVKSDERSGDFQAEANDLGLNATVTQTDLSRSGWSPYIGYQVVDKLALEIGYVDLGKSTLTLSGLAPDVDAFINTAEAVYPVTGSGLTFNFVGRASLSNKVDVLFHFGAFLWKAEYDLSSETVSKTFKDRGMSNTLGLGLEMDALVQVPVRLGWTMYRLGGVDVSAWTLGAGYRF